MPENNIPLRRESLVMNNRTFDEFAGTQYDEAMTSTAAHFSGNDMKGRRIRSMGVSSSS